MKETDVLIAGGGPVGMTLAYDLATRGVRCMLAERNAATTVHPKMDITNARTMELFRLAGLASDLRAVAVHPDHCFDVSWITNFCGSELHRFQYASVTEWREKIRRNNDGSSPAEAPMRVSQVEIEPVLRSAIEAQPLVDVRFGVEFEAMQQDESGVTVTIRRQSDGGVEQVRCKYLAGCDGGSSRVRQQLDIGLTGDARIMQRFMTHFRSDAREVLQRWGTAWHYQSAYGTLIAQNDRDLWTFHSRVPAGVPVDEVNPSDEIAKFVGKHVPHEVLVANPWSPHLLVADAYAQGRVLLAGDAAHQYIPTGGYGMNTGVADAFDLGWKLAAMLRGFGGPGLLASYDVERRPVGIRNCAGSRRHNNTRVEVAKLYSPDLHADGPAGEALRADVSARIAAIGNAENESFGLEFGYCYQGSPIVADEPDAEVSDDPVLYRPSTVPGARLPSVVLADGSLLYDHLGRWMSLLVFEGVSCKALVDAAQAMNVPLKVIALREPALRSVYQADALLVRPDQHVAWRGLACATQTEAVAVLRRALGWVHHASGAPAAAAAEVAQ